ncbi:tRNA wybutosine-synthesizing protein 4-like isoform X1 [Schistocerca piceifrons]|uniref:tRNA wybutosine-synthesizing protein 4-like isoform X1 n=2 Tax=Schistocerca piceifrons TaxID=274613 RepID=UPI001F5EB8FF|nr:tRNA wybutosine-synthesizing protein 4-like isoform X1 [Schistocerca piceifrons]
MDKNVQGTNDYSTVSKYSMVKKGYFNDEFISEFVSNSKYSRRAPIIHMGYYARAEIIEAILTQFVRHVGNSHIQIISCGAGYDTTYFRLKKNLQEEFSLTYYEVDFIEVISRKTECIRRSKILSSILGLSNDVNSCTTGIHSQGYHLVGGDLRCQNDIESVLSSAGISWAAPTLLLAECSITYMDESSSTKLIEWTSTKFPHATFVTFEQICPDDGFGHVMKHHFESLGSPLLSLNKYPDFDLQIRRYKEHGWSACASMSAYEALKLLTEEGKVNNVVRLEPFDEFESWHLMCCHYTLTIASQGVLENWFSDDRKKESINMSQNLLRYSEDNALHWSVLPVQGRIPERFGHASGRLDEHRIALVGGFGKSYSQEHSRLSEISIVNTTDFTVQHVTLHSPLPKGDSSLAAMHSTCIPLHNGRLLIIGGRTSPTRPVNTKPVILSVWNKDVEVLDLIGPCPRWRHTATLIGSESTTQLILLFGGRTSNLIVLNDLWQLSIQQRIFSQISNVSKNWPCARFSHSAVALMRCSLIITGGLNEILQPLRDIWIYDTEEGSWEEVHVKGPQMLPRYSHTSAVTSDNKFLILLGGVNTHTTHQPGVCVINLLERKCYEYALPNQDPDRPIMLHNHTSELIEDSRFLVFGGGDNCFSFGTSFNPGIINMEISHLLH